MMVFFKNITAKINLFSEKEYLIIKRESNNKLFRRVI